MPRWSIIPACVIAALPQATAADTLSRGRDMATWFLQGDITPIWDAMTAEMQAILGSPNALDQVRKDLASVLGPETGVAAEWAMPYAAYEIYERFARHGEDGPLAKLTIAFDAEGRIAGFHVTPQAGPADSPNLTYRTRTELRLPVEGPWLVYWGGRSVDRNYHAVDPGQRFALDLFMMRDGRDHSGDPGDVTRYHCWDAPILAPAGGTVVRATDGLPDNAIGERDPQNPGGNHVVIDFGNGEYGFLAHLRQGSVAVRPGDTVKSGDHLGRCGNSGNSSAPHHHFHLQTTPDLGRGLGLPAKFNDYRADGDHVARGEPERGQTVEHAGPAR
ncbi:M23 family metallopeptidase [Pseudooceanicola sp. LIPI14-2-Ac024]|uniref:M23 family metallopeptidase n=1 Tax=Pseudooceanicola sp. LIPI14-2-Ac024 TaxID=3344875 RepID=UPI0035D0DD9F